MEWSLRNSSSRSWILSFVGTLFVMFTMQMASLGFAPLLPSIQSTFKMSYSQVGLFTGMYGLLAMILSVPAGLAAQRFGEKKVLLSGILVVFCGLFLLSRAPDLTAAYLGRGVWILGYRFAFVSVMTAIAVRAPPSMKNRAMGILGAVTAVASIIGAPFGSTISRFHGWRTGILAYGLMTLVGGTCFFLFYRRARTVEPSVPGGETPLIPTLLESAFKSPLIWGMALLVGLSGLGQFCANFFIPLALRTVFQRDAFSASLVLSVGYGVGIVASLFFGYLMDRFNKWKVLSLIFFLMIPSSLAMTSRSLLLFEAGGIMVIALGLTAINQVFSVSGQILHSSEVGNVMGVVSLGAGVFGYLGPQSVGWLRDHTRGFNAGWIEIALVSCVACGLTLILKRPAEKRTLR